MTSPLTILERSFRRIEVPRTPGATCVKCGTALSGVYILVDKKEVAYVGSSIDVTRRLYAHTRERTKVFDRALWLELPRKLLRYYEAALIRGLEPSQNCMIPAGVITDYDAEILYCLGLRDDLTINDIAWQEVA